MLSSIWRGLLVAGIAQVTANIHRVFSHGHRNSFGFDFDPRSGNLWLEENGDDSLVRLDRDARFIR